MDGEFSNNISFKPSEKMLLTLLKASLTGGVISGAELASALEMKDELVRLASLHAVAPLLYPVMECRETREHAERSTQQFYRMLMSTKYAVGLLEENGICAAVLKGSAAAAYYPVPEYRKSGDIDLLLLDVSRMDEAKRILLSAGFIPTEKQEVGYHFAFLAPDGTELELHETTTEELDDREINKRISAVEAELYKTVRRSAVAGVGLPVTNDAFFAFSLLVHMLHHYLRSGFGIKLLCDWTVFWNSGISEKETGEYLKLVSECGLKGFSQAVTGVCEKYLGLAEISAEPLDGSEDLADELLREIFDSGEFGKTSNDRMVTVRGTGAVAYIREFHHQMHLNFPKAGRAFVLWPALWTATLVRFLINNRRIRHTTLRDVIRSTKGRSGLTKKLNLFRIEK